MSNCPRCDKPITDAPALSRVDNATNICSPCGTLEAMFTLLHPGEPMTPTNKPVW